MTPEPKAALSQTQEGSAQAVAPTLAAPDDVELLLRRALETADVLSGGDKIGPMVGSYAAICLRALHSQLRAALAAGQSPSQTKKGSAPLTDHWRVLAGRLRGSVTTSGGIDLCDPQLLHDAADCLCELAAAPTLSGGAGPDEGRSAAQVDGASSREGNQMTTPRDTDKLVEALKEARDLLMERKYGSAARSPGHNARLVIDAALSEHEAQPPQEDGWRPTHRHVKRGTEYEVIGTALIQTSDLLTDGNPVTVYRGRDGDLWARSVSEFNDGRFEVLPAPPQEREGEGR